MPFINKILEHRSLSIIGMEKNVGKTVTLNYVLDRLSERNINIGLTSIGIDGEGTDQVTQTSKPEITLTKGTVFSTTEQHYQRKQLVAEVLDLSDYRTSLGRIVTAKALSQGKSLISGPADTVRLTELIVKNKQRGIDLTIVDGALSRKSLASPSVTEAMILATGAAYSINPKQLVRGTAFLCSLIQIEEVDPQIKSMLSSCDNGVYALSACGELNKLTIPSAVLFERNKEELFRYGNTLYINGILSDKLLEYLRLQKQCASCTIIIKDFTQLFITPEVFAAFSRKGGKIRVLHRSKLIAVTLNPTSPSGYKLDSETICRELSAAIDLPVYDVLNINR